MSTTEPSTEVQPNAPLPKVAAFKTETLAGGAATDDGDRNPVFTSLVTEDTDVVGLVAYSVYKQNKHDWLLAFAKSKGRDPDEAEVSAYIIGESTPRRLATYRHLAHATLEGKGPDVQVGAGAHPASGRSLLSPSHYESRGAGQTVWARSLGYVVTAVVVGLAVLLAIRFGLIPSPR